MVRRRPFDLDCDGPVDHDVGPRAAERLFDRDRSTEFRLEEAGQFDLVRKLVIILPRWPEFFDGGCQAREVLRQPASGRAMLDECPDRKSTRLNSSHGYISYAVFCLKKKKASTASEANQT